MFLNLSIPDHAYFFGFVQTDGSLSAGRGQKGKLSVELQARDAPLLQAFQRLLPFNSSIVVRTRDTNFATGYRSVVWTMPSLAGRLELIELGLPVGRKSTIVKPPSAPFSARDYLRGLIDGDGSVGITARGYPFVSLTTASPALATFFCNELKVLTDVDRKVAPNTRDHVYNPMVTMEPAVALANFLYYDGCLALPRKFQVASGLRDWVRPDGMRARSVRRRWTPEEDRIAMELPLPEAAMRLHRTYKSVNLRRWRLRQEPRTYELLDGAKQATGDAQLLTDMPWGAGGDARNTT